MVANALVGAVGLDAAPKGPLASHVPWARPSSRGAAEADVGCAAGRTPARPRAAAGAGPSQGQCGLWYSSGRPSVSMRPSRFKGWRYARVPGRVWGGTKFAWELHATPSAGEPGEERLVNSTPRTPSAELTFTLDFPADGMAIYVAHMLDCCHYGRAESARLPRQCAVCLAAPGPREHDYAPALHVARWRRAPSGAPHALLPRGRARQEGRPAGAHRRPRRLACSALGHYETSHVPVLHRLRMPGAAA